MAKLVNVAKPIILENKETGEKLTIDFDRETIYQMDEAGAIGASFMENLGEKPLSSMAVLFYWGLKKNRPETTVAEAKELLFDKIGIDMDMFSRLTELFLVPYTSIMESRKNSVWTMQ